MRLIINGIDIELTESQTIARTLQVNDILTLSDRQTNYTNTFSIKKTDKNKQTFEMLGVVGATSILPYRKNECYLYTDDGECMVYKGWAIIQSTDKEYKINIYDGNIDLYKAIENKNLGELDLSEINHQKTLTTVVNSFTAGLNYKYIVADYNGLMVYNTNRINIDYLVPSAKVSYLWNKIFTTYGFTYSGSVFNTVDFTNLWLTYPKFAELDVTPVSIFEGTTQSIVDNQPVMPLQFNQSIVVDTIQDVNKQEFIISTSGTYRIELNDLGGGSISYQIGDWADQFLYNLYFNTPIIYKNGVQIGSSNDDYIDVNLIAGDVITIDYGYPDNLGQNSILGVTYLGTFQSTLIIKEFQGVPISFSNELKDFSTRDFITEILNRFGLTPFKDKYENHYRFLTLQELLQDNTVVDWSREQNKFVEKLSERYIFGSYAQQNKFTYKYNDNESDYYNSEILIDNVNLADNKVVVNSKVYAPEKDSTNLIHDLDCNVYKMWDKEVQDNGSVKYKGLSKRYYLMREDSHTFTATTQIGSQSLNAHQAITTVPVASFYNLRMEDVVRIYYSNIGAILNYSKIIDASIYLNEKNVSDIDFSKIYWIKQLSSYFLLNKVNNFTKKGITKVELIKVEYTAPSVQIFSPYINFGFGQRIKTSKTGDNVTIYQDTLYNSAVYDTLIINNGTVVSSELNKIVVNFTSTGAYTLNVTVISKDKSTSYQSNNIIITVT
jgi:hypothetical protein